MSGFGPYDEGDDSSYQDDSLKKKLALPIRPPSAPMTEIAPGTNGMTSTGPLPVIAKPPSQSGPPPLNVPAVGQQTQKDQAELNRLQTTGSGLSQLQHKHPILGGILKGLSIAGNIAAPWAMAAIPGTDLHHNVLLGSQRNAVASDIGQDEKAAQAAESQARADEIANPPQKEPTTAFELWHKQNPEGTYQDWLKLQQKPEIQISNPQEGYARAIADAIQNGRDPNSDPHVMAWRAAVDQLRPDKEPNRDDKAIAIMSKPENTWTPEEAAYMKGYRQFVKENKIDPGVSRMQVLVNGRPIDVVDPDNPTNIIPMRTGQAIETKASRPQSGEATGARKVTESAIAGPIGNEINAFNTALAHADLLEKAAAALQNGDSQTLNSITNKFKNEFGNSGPITAQAIADAYTREVNKMLTSNHISDAEIATIGKTVDPQKQNLKTISSVLGAYKALAASKLQMRQQQLERGQKGEANFPKQEPPRPSSVPADYVYQENGPKGKGWYKPNAAK